jgi:sugar/nucleoside kinase (ribokinase family)
MVLLQVAEAFPNAQGVLVTAGEEGASYCFKSSAKGENAGFIPCFNIKVDETTGAGDAFTAGFIYKLLQVCVCVCVCGGGKCGCVICTCMHVGKFTCLISQA